MRRSSCRRKLFVNVAKPVRPVPSLQLSSSGRKRGIPFANSCLYDLEQYEKQSGRPWELVWGDPPRPQWISRQKKNPAGSCPHRADRICGRLARGRCRENKSPPRRLIRLDSLHFLLSVVSYPPGAQFMRRKKKVFMRRKKKVLILSSMGFYGILYLDFFCEREAEA